jgi:hypothetical protein
MNKDQYNILMSLINAYGEAEENFGDVGSKENEKIANDLYLEIQEYLNYLYEGE